MLRSRVIEILTEYQLLGHKAIHTSINNQIQRSELQYLVFRIEHHDWKSFSLINLLTHQKSENFRFGPHQETFAHP